MAVIDSAVYPNPRKPDDIRQFLPRAMRDRPFPSPYRYLYPPPTGIAPFGVYAATARETDGMPGSDPTLTRTHLAGVGIGRAVLLPLTRGVLPNLELGSAVCAATNAWLAETWLPDGFYRGSIRVNPLDVDAAVAEVERWAGDPRFVQVGVPLEAQMPYGHRTYHRLWAAVSAAGLPVALHCDGFSGASFHPTPSGFPRHYIEFASLHPSNFIYHLTSLIAEGVFERLPALRFVFTDGAFDVLMPLMWRMDMDWPITRIEAPWVKQRPMRYLADHVRFVTNTFEGPENPGQLTEWAATSGASDLLMYGSHYPQWQFTSPADVLSGLSEPDRKRILMENAESFYALGASVTPG